MSTTSSLGRRARLGILIGALGLVLAMPAAVSADTTGGPPSIGPATSHDATIAITSITVTGKVLATVKIAYVCQPFQTYDWQTGETHSRRPPVASKAAEPPSSRPRVGP